MMNDFLRWSRFPLLASPILWGLAGGCSGRVDLADGQGTGGAGHGGDVDGGVEPGSTGGATLATGGAAHGTGGNFFQTGGQGGFQTGGQGGLQAGGQWAAGGANTGGAQVPYYQCFTPILHLETAYLPGGNGCACKTGTDLDTCRKDKDGRLVSLVCQDDFWTAVEDGPCAPLPYTVCGQPKAGGSCDNIGTERYFFDTAAGKCHPFQYHCDGNDNNFGSVDDCRIQCEIPSVNQKLPCLIPPAPGECNTPVGRFFYDPKTRACQPFKFGSCGYDEGYLNNYTSRAACETSCAEPYDGGAH